MKKLLCLLLTGVMTLSMLACGSTATVATQSESTQTAEADVTEAADAAEVTADTTQTVIEGEAMELTMYFPVSVGGGPDALIDALCKQYHEENPNITINPVYAGSYADTRTKVQAAIKGGNTPDMAIMFSIDLYSLLAMDAIADLTASVPQRKTRNG